MFGFIVLFKHIFQVVIHTHSLTLCHMLSDHRSPCTDPALTHSPTYPLTQYTNQKHLKNIQLLETIEIVITCLLLQVEIDLTAELCVTSEKQTSFFFYWNDKLWKYLGGGEGALYCPCF